MEKIDRTKMFGDMITRRVRVDLSISPQQALEATGALRQYTNQEAVDAMPRSESEEVEIFFFPFPRWATPAEVQEAYEFRGLKPVDPFSLAKANEDDLELDELHSNATHWIDVNGVRKTITFYRCNDERVVYVGRPYIEWRGVWCFAGVRK